MSFDDGGTDPCGRRPGMPAVSRAGRSAAASLKLRLDHAEAFVDIEQVFRGKTAAASLKRVEQIHREGRRVAAAVSTRPAALWIGCGELEPEMLFRHP